jgi:hypothetical protein
MRAQPAGFLTADLAETQSRHSSEMIRDGDAIDAGVEHHSRDSDSDHSDGSDGIDESIEAFKSRVVAKYGNTIPESLRTSWVFEEIRRRERRRNRQYQVNAGIFTPVHYLFLIS